PADLVRGAAGPEDALTTLGRLLLGSPLAAAASQAMLSAYGERPDPQDPLFAAIIMAGILASPAFQWR
ncbi:MAG: hypothetical protein ACRDG5_00315, partial [Anaerolineales bacterium]